MEMLFWTYVDHATHTSYKIGSALAREEKKVEATLKEAKDDRAEKLGIPLAAAASLVEISSFIRYVHRLGKAKLKTEPRW